MVLHIDTDKMEALGLTDREMWLYLTLTILCCHKPWKGTDEELAERCKNHMSRVTILRLKKSLIDKGLIQISPDGLVIVQNEQSSVQNEQSSVQNEQSSVQNEQSSVQNEQNRVQNEQNSKEKEKYQKKIEKEDGKGVLSAHTREEVFLFDCYKVAITEFGYLHPKILMDEMYNFYNSHAWPDGWHNDRKTDVWRYWLGREGKIKGGRQPELSEAVRPVMDTLIAHIPPQVIPRLTEVVQAVTLDEQKIRFMVRSSDAESFAAWLQKIDIVRILAAFHKEITVARE